MLERSQSDVATAFIDQVDLVALIRLVDEVHRPLRGHRGGIVATDSRGLVCYHLSHILELVKLVLELLENLSSLIFLLDLLLVRFDGVLLLLKLIDVVRVFSGCFVLEIDLRTTTQMVLDVLYVDRLVMGRLRPFHRDCFRVAVVSTLYLNGELLFF